MSRVLKKTLYIFMLTLVIVFAMTISASAASPDDNYAQMLISAEHQLSRDYAPSSLTRLSNYMRAGGNVMLTEAAAIKCGEMIEAMRAAGLTDIYGQSGYRSYDTQSTLHNNRITRYRNEGYSLEEAQYLAARIVHIPGASEHQTGMAIDFTTSANGNGLVESFADTPVGIWLAENSWRYGFILRYPQDKEHTTNIVYEPWHFRYIGEPHAEYMYKNNLCLEEYFALLQAQGVITYRAENGVEYAIFYTDHNNVQHTGSVLLGASRAYPETDIGYITTTTVPADTELFDIIGHWGESYIRALSTMEIITGYPNNTFLPEKNISRAELISLSVRVYELLYPEGSENGLSKEDRSYIESLRAAYTSPYADVPFDIYYYEPLLVAELKGLLPADMVSEDIGGVRLFYPDKVVLRREAAQSLAPLFAEREIAFSGTVLADMAGLDAGLQSAVQLLVDAGILTGDAKGNFNADSNITRAEISAMLYRILAFFEFFPEMYPEGEEADSQTDEPGEQKGRIVLQ